MSNLPTGKLPAQLLDEVLSRLPTDDPRLLIGPRLGEDAAVIDIGDRYLVVTTDPITFATDRIGWYSVHVNANDVAVLGATPRWFSAVVLLPEGEATGELAASVMADIGDTCRELGVTVCGGHTEVTTGIGRPIVVGQMIGEAERPELARKDCLQIGDRILLARGIAIEGTALLAREKFSALVGRVPDDVVARAATLLFDPGISVVKPASVARRAGRVHAMHDPTEGGIATALWELAQAGTCGLLVDGDAIPVLPETRAVCDALQLDPFRLISSGALLVAVPQEEAAPVARALEAAGIPAADIGEVVSASEGTRLRRAGRWEPLQPADRDEIARVFGS